MVDERKVKRFAAWLYRYLYRNRSAPPYAVHYAGFRVWRWSLSYKGRLIGLFRGGYLTAMNTRDMRPSAGRQLLMQLTSGDRNYWQMNWVSREAFAEVQKQYCLLREEVRGGRKHRWPAVDRLCLAKTAAATRNDDALPHATLTAMYKQRHITGHASRHLREALEALCRKYKVPVTPAEKYGYK